jgi:hypothetical protein
LLSVKALTFGRSLQVTKGNWDNAGSGESLKNPNLARKVDKSLDSDGAAGASAGARRTVKTTATMNVNLRVIAPVHIIFVIAV